MSNLTVFQFDGQGVRFVGTPDKPEWVAQDICKVLDIDRTQIRRLESYQKGVCIIHTLGGNQEMATVTEAGLYALIFTSRKPIAKDFQRWVFEEVLPSIRKTGQYSVTQSPALGAYQQRVKEMFDPKNKVKDGYWCVLHESANLLIWIETQTKYPVDKADLLDGSIGKHWSKYRDGKPWALDRIKFKYTFPDSNRTVEPWCYRMSELGEFRQYLNMDYTPTILPVYLKKKYPGIIKFQP